MEVKSLVSLPDIRAMLDVAQCSPRGIFVEVGVYQGGTAYFLAQLARMQSRALWLFDTFAGMPESTAGLDKHPVGDFADCSLEAVAALIPDALIFPGMFPGTLPERVPPVGFAHIDCDNYESVKACIERLAPVMAPGGIMYFDDYGCLEGAIRAVDELCPGRIVLANLKAMVIFP